MMDPKKLSAKAPKAASVDSIVECCLQAFDAIRAQKSATKGDSKTKEAYERAVGVLNQLAATMAKNTKGIGGTQGLTLADIFVLTAAYPMFADQKRKPDPKVAQIAAWTKKIIAEQKWVSAVKASPGDIDLSVAPSPAAGAAAAGRAAASRNKKGAKKERDVSWMPIVPPGHTRYSWPMGKKKAAAGGAGGKKAAYSKTPAVPDPAEWKDIEAKAKADSSKPKLPIPGAKNILITSALPYVNNVPHLGNIIGCVLSADVYSRYCRLRGYNSVYVCGTDEYGTTTEMKAYQEGLTNQQICDKYHAIHKEIYQWFNIGFDHFGRTTTQQQTEIAQDIYKRARANGFVVEKETQQLYDTKLNKFLADRYVEGTCPKCGYEKARGDQCDKCGSIDYTPVELKNPVSVLTKNTPEVRGSKHLYLDLPKLKDRLWSFVEDSQKKGRWTGNASSETDSWINKRGLLPRCITRDLKWGTPVPEKGYEDKVFYVWFDAPIGYISITATYTPEWEKWWKNETKDVRLVQFMGKDNIPFHTVIFPCTLLAASNPESPKDNFVLLDSISVCDYLQYEGGLKFSKSRGTGVFGNNAKETGIAAPIWRYYLLSVRPENQDSEFDWQKLHDACRGELIGNFGNFINRTLSFLGKMGGVVPPAKLLPKDREFFRKVSALVDQYVDLMEKIAMRDALRLVLEVSRLGNGLFQHEAPWDLMKKGDGERTASVLAIAVQLVWVLAALCKPFMPSVATEICRQLAVPEATLFFPGSDTKSGFKCQYGPPSKTWSEAKAKGGLFVGHKIGKAKPLFARIEQKMLDQWRKKYGGVGSVTTGELLFPFYMLVAEIKEIDPHPTAAHLAVLKVDLGPGKGSKTLVSGIGDKYPDLKAALLGAKVLVIENVQPSNFKGVKTSALLLCAETPSGKRAIELPRETPAGIICLPKGSKLNKNKFPSKQFGKSPMTIGADGIVTFANRNIEGAKGAKLPTIPSNFRGKIVI